MTNWTQEDMLEVTLKESDDFLKVRETLSRIGVSSKKTNTLYQSCHILHKQGKYYIVHFKELFALDGRPVNFDENDIPRRNRIAQLLEEWKLVTIVRDDSKSLPVIPMVMIKIVSYKDKKNWNLEAKYELGRPSSGNVDSQ